MKIVRVLFRSFIVLSVIVLIHMLLVKYEGFGNMYVSDTIHADDNAKDIYDFINQDIAPNIPMLLERASGFSVVPQQTQTSGFQPSDTLQMMSESSLPFANFSNI